MNIKHIKVISIDMFGTLADVHSRYYVIWQTFLRDKYSDELADQYLSSSNTQQISDASDSLRNLLLASEEVMQKQTKIMAFFGIGNN